MSKNDEEHVLEIATNLALKLLIGKKSFIEEIENRIENNLRQDCIKSDVESHRPNKTFICEPKQAPRRVVIDVVRCLNELIINLNNATRIFNEHFDPMYYDKDQMKPNRSMSLIFEIGLKVDRLRSIDNEEDLQKSICCACRRICHALRVFANRCMSYNHYSNMTQMSTKLSEFCFTIIDECKRFLELLLPYSSNDLDRSIRLLKMSLKRYCQNVVNILEEMDRKKCKNTPCSSSNFKFASSVEDGIRFCGKSTLHKPGTIADSILKKDFLLNDKLRKARQRVRHSKRPIENMDCATVITKQIIAELKNSLNLGNHDRLLIEKNKDDL